MAGFLTYRLGYGVFGTVDATNPTLPPEVSTIPGVPTTGLTTPAVINFSANGDNTVVAAIGGQTIRVMRLMLTASAATLLTFKDGAGKSLSGPMSFNASGALVLDLSGEPWFVASVGDFIINQSGTAQISGTVWFTQS